jgi:hypothetical protein
MAEPFARRPSLATSEGFERRPSAGKQVHFAEAVEVPRMVPDADNSTKKDGFRAGSSRATTVSHA